MSEVIEAEKLKQIIHKIENIEQEKLEASDLLKDVFNEAKSMGFDVKIIKHVIKLRKKDKNALAEEDSLIELYRGALGCDYIVTNQIAEQLNKSNEYRVIRKYIKPEFYNDESISSNTKRIGVFLDVESTGLSYSNNKLIELGMVKFEYTEDGRIFRLLDEFNGYQDPEMSIPEHITRLTGITNDMVAGQHIDERKVTDYLHEVDLVIAHNALFDRAFFETTFPNTPPKAWACSMSDIHWKDEDISSFKLSI